MKVFVTGYGAISAIGLNAEQHFDALKKAKSGVHAGQFIHTKDYLVGEVPFSNKELKEHFSLKTPGSRTALLGMIAAREAFSEHKLHAGVRTGLISGTSVGGMDLTETEYLRFLAGGNYDKELFRFHSSGNTTQEIADELGITGFQNTISTACSSAANAMMMGARLIRQNVLDRVIVGGTDALSRFTIAGFRSLMIFDENWCRPFDETRKGLNLGEGAGYLVLESQKSIEITGKKPLAVLSGWGNAADAFHQTASSPDGAGATLAMKEALKIAALEPEEIDYVNAHGTATPNNDLSESKALQNVFGNRIPPFSSTKAFTGHTLAACGGIEAVFAILALQKKCLLPNLNFSQPIEETGLIPVTEYQHTEKLDHILSNSFGFSGNNSTLIFSRFKE